MSPSKPRNYNHMRGDVSFQEDIQVRCVLEFDDNETFCNKNKMALLPSCPAMRQRLSRHMRKCHGRPIMDIGTSCSNCQTFQFISKEESKSVCNKEILTDFFGKSVALSPSLSMDDKLTCSFDQSQISKGLEREENSRSRHSKNDLQETHAKDNDCNVETQKANDYKLKTTETVILHPRGQYRDHLRTIISEWLMEVPVIPNKDAAAKTAKRNAFNELNDAICRLCGDVNEESYEDYVKAHIRKFIEKIPIWFMCTLKEQEVYKAHLINNLFQRIKLLNMETFNESYDKTIGTRKCSHRKTDRHNKIEDLVMNYLKNLDFVDRDKWGNAINMNKVKRVVLNRLKPAVNAMSRVSDRLYLKIELKNILRDLPLAWPHNRDENLDKYAEELAINIQAVGKHVCFRNNNNNICVKNLEAIYGDQRQIDLIRYETIQNIIQFINNTIDCNRKRNYEDELVDIIQDSYDSIQSGNESDARSAIYEYLKTIFDITKESAASLANSIVAKLKNETKLVADKSCSSVFLNNNMLSKNITVFVSDHDLSGQAPSNYPITSTPKKEIPKFNAEERKYTDDLTKLISNWIDTIPELVHVKDDKNYKEAMVSDLGGRLTDEIKLEQYEPNKKYYDNRENMIICAIRSWMIKFEESTFKTIQNIDSYTDDFIKQFNKIPIPILTRPQHGNRNDMKNLMFRSDISDLNIDFVPDPLDIIEDGVSIWMNEQPTNIYKNENRDSRNEMIHNFAAKIHNHLKNKRSSNEIKLETRLFLDKMLKPNEKKDLDILSENLKNRIIKMPINESFNSGIGNLKENTEKEDLLAKSVDVNTPTDFNLNKTLKNFIDTFIEHNCEEDDTIVKSAYCEILKSEFRRYSPQAKDELYSKCGAKCKLKDNLPLKLKMELFYIKEISDWLKNIPIESSFNKSGNKNRIDFVINLARDICEVEMEKMQAPDAMDYETYLCQRILLNYVKKLPILPKSIQYQPQMTKEIMLKIVNGRDKLNQINTDNKTINDSFEMQEQNIGEFIDEYIRVNGKEIADDPLKLEVWNARLLKEINRMVQESEPTPSFKTKVYNRLAEIPPPGNDSVIEFNRKLKYAHEIGDWIKNMPLQPISDQKITDTIARMINDLAEKLAEKESCNIKNDPELTQYVKEWILALPLESGKALETSILIEQLSNRINRVDEGKNQSSDISNNNGNKNLSKINKNDSRRSFLKIQKRNSSTGKNKVGCSAELVVEAIEDWCKKLPIKEKKEYDENIIKENVAVRLFQKVGELNLDPRLNDNILYRDQLGSEIDKIFKDLQRYNDLIKRKEDLKSNLINSIIKARDIVKERTAGNQYRHKLENTIEASIPSPITYSKIYDPGFELYKNKLANMFILENFDHGDDPVKLKYEVKIKNEIDKYFSEAQKRNAIPLSRDDIYNELYSALFKVPIPNEKSVIQEVEEVKLRCEIDGWFEGLPIREAINLNELLDWDQILEMLTKRIYEIENNEPNSEDIIHKEVAKWLVKFPLLPGEENNIDKYVKSLVDRIKASKNQRKCTPKSKKDKGKGKSSKKVSSKRDSVLVNKTQSPGVGEGSIMWRTDSIRTNQLSDGSLNPCCVQASTPKRKPADLMLEIVENWCQSLPLFPAPGENESTIKDDLMTKILRKLSELNNNPEIFDDDFLYDDYLDDELDRLMQTLPMCCELQKNTEFKKIELISALGRIKPFIRAENARHKYKKEVRRTVRNMLQGPLDKTPEKALFEDLVDEIADSFVQYNYNKDNHEEKQIYRKKIRDAIIKHYAELDDEADDDLLITQNKLICELGKIPNPGEEAIKEDVEEIKMKEEVANFIEEVIPNGNTDQNKLIKTTLSKRLHDLKKSGHSCATDKSMTEEIARSFKKANVNVGLDKIENFVNTLKNNEPIRKSPPAGKSDDLQTSMNISQQLKQRGWQSGQFPNDSAKRNYEYQPQTPLNDMFYQDQPSESIKYYTLLPESPVTRPPPGAIPVAVQEPQATQWYRPNASQHSAVGSQEMHTIPPYSFSQTLPPDILVRSPPSARRTSLSPSLEPRLPQEMLQSNLSRRKSPQSTNIPTIGPNGSIPIQRLPNMPLPGKTSDHRFLPRTQARRQSLGVSSTQSGHKALRKTSLQIPLRHDNDMMYDRTRYDSLRHNSIPQSYREVCHQPQGNITGPHSPPINAAGSLPQSPQVANLISYPSASRSPPQSPRTSTQPQLYHPSPQSQRNASSQRQTPIVESAMSSRPVQSYQGFQNAVDAVSSPAQLPVLGLAPNIPIAGVPQSTRNAASIRLDVGPTVSDIPQGTPEDMSAPEGTHRMATAPLNHMTNPPRKRRISPGEEGREDICDCFLPSSRKRRCMPLPPEWGSFPIWCYMPVPSLCYF